MSCHAVDVGRDEVQDGQTLSVYHKLKCFVFSFHSDLWKTVERNWTICQYISL